MKYKSFDIFVYKKDQNQSKFLFLFLKHLIFQNSAQFHNL